MKSIVTRLLGLSALSLITGCTTIVDTPGPSTHTTTTAEVAPATYGSVETKTTRTY